MDTRSSAGQPPVHRLSEIRDTARPGPARRFMPGKVLAKPSDGNFSTDKSGALAHTRPVAASWAQPRAECSDLTQLARERGPKRQRTGH